MQDRKTYAKGSTLESTTGYVVKVGMPFVDDTVTANQYGSAEFTLRRAMPDDQHISAIPDGQYLITLEVNGEAIAYKDTVTVEGGELTVGEYDISCNEDYAAMEVNEGDIVRLLIEPLEVSVSDGFRAAINKAVPLSGGGSGGSGVLIVNMTEDQETGNAVLDKTWAEISDAPIAFVSTGGDLDSSKSVWPVCAIGIVANFVTGTTTYHVDVVMIGETMEDTTIARFTSETKDGVLTYVWE